MTKRGACPHCCPNGGAILDQGWSIDQPVWICRNCGEYQKRRIHLRGARVERRFHRQMRALATFAALTKE